MRNIKYIVLHCTATPQTATIESIKRYWKEVLGWKNPGYHWLITPEGEAVELLPIDKVANGVKGYNRDSIHISYIGGVDDTGKAFDNRTIQQEATQLELVKKYKAMFPKAEVLGHRDFPNVHKDCPSFDVARWLQQVGLLLAACLMLACGSKKKATQRSESSQVTQTAQVTRVSTVKKETLKYGDTLTGSFPLPALSDLPVTVPVSSAGLELEISLTGNQVSYKAVAKPIALITSQQVTANTTANSSSEKATRREEETKERRSNLPWWLYVIAILIAIAGLAWLTLKYITPIKNIFKTLLK